MNTSKLTEKNLLPFFVALSVFVALSAGSFAQSRIVEPRSRALLGGSKTNCTDGTRLYLGAGGTIAIGLIVSTDSVEFLSEYYLPSVVQGLSVRGNILFATDLLTGLHVLDVTDAHQPRELTRLSLSHRSYGLLRDSTLLFVAHGDDGISKIDISDPGHPSLMASAGYLCWQLRSRPPFVYCVHSNLITIVNRSTLDSVGALPLRILTPFGNEILGLELSNSNGILVENYFGDLPGEEWAYLTLLDMSMPAALSRRGRLELPPLDAFKNRGDTLFCTARDTVFFVSSDSVDHPRLISRSTGIHADFVTIKDTMVLASRDYRADFQIVDIRDIQNPRNGYYRSTLADVGSVFATDSLLVAGRLSSEGLSLVDITDPARPRTTYSYTYNIGSVRGITMRNGLLFAASGQGLKVLRTIGNDSISLVGELNYGSWAMQIDVADTLVATGGYYYHVHLISVADPANPRYIVTVPMPSGMVIEDIHLRDTLLFVTGRYGGVRVYSVASPAAPRLLWNHYYSLSEAIHPFNRILLVADNSTLRAFDMTDPASPIEVGSANLGRRIIDLSVRDSLAFVAVFSNGYTEDNGMVVLNIRTLSAMHEIARANTAGWSNAIFATNDFVFLSDHLNGAYIFDRSDIITCVHDSRVVELPKLFGLSQNFPNPFNPTTEIGYRIADCGLVMLKVFDVLGREVATLVNEEKQPGTYSVLWNAPNAASGMYFYRLSATDFVQTRKLLLLR